MPCLGGPMASKPLTVDDLCVYFERQVKTCDRTMETLSEFAKSEPVHSHAYNHRIAEHQATAIRRHVYQQLIDIIDRGELPD